ncbi:dihydrodipicolinate reductase [Peptoclostridium litorale DSM 5388]|uniref:4-hydroxy-tetrahydrodipicolinate reductase n=1 Tax=Peptoclostridium litorale DSM 5388 TaxID=1121324 RepID=A0A069RGK2_PEPLI|nr:4-hydroxy-tetrahydrodipicolinate reductase [Peptoclostridium litorale]KDR93883.1 4-hydroxy-tetrahydrodipicolinate reductase DapB [Peptoclostridium litorale DSM 5388]KDR95310.1 4-hydroxy-tetrahydrodipicolinate reductase DapB [Peptoclostridium litorale DSM 5388]SIN87826.1 dihydrodipicolinate reductase [Peptoclostridium litorale DSM 5388]
MLNVIINGALGKMGKVLIQSVEDNPGISLAGAVDKGAENLSEKPEWLYSSVSDIEGPVDAVVDFSRPEALPELVGYCKEKGCALVLATTGYSDDELQMINDASKDIAVFHSYNMSLGVNLMLSLVSQAAKALSEFDIEIVEKHHNEKVDAPSGTAIMIANAINEALENSMQMNYGRYGNDCKRNEKEIGIHAVRGGTIVGEHTAIFAGKDEIVEVNHMALSKKIFAEGALKAAQFMSGKSSGYYNMQDLFKS